MNAIAFPVQQEQHRVYKRAGCFNLTAVIAVPADAVKDGMSVSLSKSWLPLSDKKFDVKGPAGYTHPNVIPVLSDRVFNRLAPSIDAYAARHKLVLQPVLFFYRPQALADILATAEREEDRHLAKALPGLSRKQKMEDRIFIDTTVQNESNDVMQGLNDICTEILEQAKLGLSDLAKAPNPRIGVSTMLMDYPFLAQHIFAKLPKLILLRHKARVNGRVEVINHIRYDPKAVFEIDLDKLYRKLDIDVKP